MTVNPVSASASTYGAADPSATAAPATGQNSLDQDAFLQLLIASLKYQDPSEPMSTGELMQQTTQLSMMQAMTEMQALAKDQFNLQVTSSAIALVGKQVSYVGADGQSATGLAESVRLVGGSPVLSVNGTEVPVSALIGVGAAAAATPPADSSTSTPSGGPAATTEPTA